MKKMKKRLEKILEKKHGMEPYAKLSLSEIKDGLSKGKAVIDGLYSWSEYKYLNNDIENKIVVIAIFAQPEIRYERLGTRKKRPLCREEAKKRDIREIEKLEKGGPIAIADHTIIRHYLKI